MYSSRILLTVVLTISFFALQASSARADQWPDAVKKELYVWEQVIPVIPQLCGNGKKPMDTKPDEAVEITECITGVVNEKVVPDVVYPDLVTEMRERAMKNSKLYEKGLITKEEWVLRGKQGWDLYMQNLEDRVYKPYVTEE